MQRSFKYSDYLVPLSYFNSSYEILDEQRREDGTKVYRAYIRDSSTLVEITRSLFSPSLHNVKRFQALVYAHEQNIILAHKIFLVESFNSTIDLFIAEYCFTTKTGDDQDIYSLHTLLAASNSFSFGSAMDESMSAHRQICVQAVRKLHCNLLQPHLALHPCNILVEHKCTIYLRPFSIDFLNSQVLPSRLLRDISPHTWLSYEAPEYLFNARDYQDQPSCDIWTLGCIFFQIFVSVTPLFQAHDPLQKLEKIFTVMGIPNKNELPYVSRNSYKLIFQTCCKNGQPPKPLLFQWSHALHKSQLDLLLGFLELNNSKRMSAESAEQHDLFLHYFSQQRITQPQPRYAEEPDHRHILVDKSDSIQVVSSEKSPSGRTSPLRNTPSYLKKKVKPYREADLLVENFKRASEKLKNQNRQSTIESNCMSGRFPLTTTQSQANLVTFQDMHQSSQSSNQKEQRHSASFAFGGRNSGTNYNLPPAHPRNSSRNNFASFRSTSSNPYPEYRSDSHVFGIDGRSVSVAPLLHSDNRSLASSETKGGNLANTLRTANFLSSGHNSIYEVHHREQATNRTLSFNNEREVIKDDKENCMMYSQKPGIGERRRVGGYLGSGAKRPQKEEQPSADNHLILEIKKFMNLEQVLLRLRFPKEPRAIVVKFELPCSTTSVPPALSLSPHFVRFREAVLDYRNTELHFRVPINSKNFAKEFKKRQIQLMISTEQKTHSEFEESERQKESLLGFVNIDLIMLFSHYSNYEINGFFHIFKSPGGDSDSVGQVCLSMTFEKSLGAERKQRESLEESQILNHEKISISEYPEKKTESNEKLFILSPHKQELLPPIKRVNYFSFDVQNPLSDASQYEDKPSILSHEGAKIKELAELEHQMNNLKENLQSWDKKLATDQLKSRLISPKKVVKPGSSNDFAETLAQLKQMIFLEE